MKLGLFDIMQIDPTQQVSIAEMFARRLDHLQLADELGFDAAFFAERHFMRQYAIPSVTAWIAAASQRTTSMRLGALGYTVPIKEPVQLAEDIAILDQLSNGRFEAGFGLGHRVEELTALAQDPAMRNQVFQAKLAVVRGLLQGGTVTADQFGVVANAVNIWPLSVQQPGPPLWFAGTDAKAAYWAASQGIGLAVGFKPTAALTATVGAYRGGQQLAKDPKWEDRPLGSVLLMRNVYVADSDEQAIREVADDLRQLQDLVGGDQSADDFASQARQMITDEIMIAGSPETVAKAIAASRKLLGIDTFLANVHAMGMDEDRIQRSIRLLAGPVRSAIADL